MHYTPQARNVYQYQVLANKSINLVGMSIVKSPDKDQSFGIRFGVKMVDQEMG